MTLNPNQFGEQQLPLDWEGIDRKNRRNAVKGYKMRSWDYPGMEYHQIDKPNLITRSIGHMLSKSSGLPTHLLTKLSGPIETHWDNNVNEGSAYYDYDQDEVNILGVGNPDNTKRELQRSIVHELGHRFDLKNNGKGAVWRREKPPIGPMLQHPDNNDPRLEGFADGFMVKYGHASYLHDPKRASKALHNYVDPYETKNAVYPNDKTTDHRDWFKDIEEDTKNDKAHLTSYGHESTILPGRDSSQINTFGWDEGDQLIYHATRAHAAATGERVPVDQRLPHENNTHDVGEHLHKLTSLSPHVEPALRDLGIWDTAKKHIDTWTENQPKVTQLSFEGDNDTTSRYIPASHMSSQFY